MLSMQIAGEGISEWTIYKNCGIISTELLLIGSYQEVTLCGYSGPAYSSLELDVSRL